MPLYLFHLRHHHHRSLGPTSYCGNGYWDGRHHWFPPPTYADCVLVRRSTSQTRCTGAQTSRTGFYLGGHSEAISYVAVLVFLFLSVLPCHQKREQRPLVSDFSVLVKYTLDLHKQERTTVCNPSIYNYSSSFTEILRSRAGKHHHPSLSRNVSQSL
jgi:hypothetical protein